MGKALPIHSARIRISSEGRILADENQSLEPDADKALFTIDAISAGPARIETWFYDADGEELCGAYYVYVSPGAKLAPAAD